MTAHNFIFWLVIAGTILCLSCGRSDSSPPKPDSDSTLPVSPSPKSEVTVPDELQRPMPEKLPQAQPMRYGLSLARRQQIFQELVRLQDDADRWASKNLLNSSGSPLPAWRIPDPPARLANPYRTIAAQFGISPDTVQKIGHEGSDYYWTLAKNKQ